nr:retrovirus-related Pol polyprotein from transposon TNT 1-94 [Tanacetum cinerariifolium]
FQPSDGYHVVPPPYTRTFMPPKPNLVFNTAPTAVETDHYAFHVQLSSTKPDQDLSHTHRPTAPIIEDWVSNFEDESETKAPQIVPSFAQSIEQVKSPRHSVSVATPKPSSPKPTSNGKRMNRKACFVCKSLDHLIKDCDYHKKKMAQPTPRNHAHRSNHKQYAPMTHHNTQKHMVSATVLTQSKLVPITVVRPVSVVVPKLKVTRPRHAKQIVTKRYSPTRRHITSSPSPKASNSLPRVTAVKAPVVNAAQGLQAKWKWRPKCLVLDHVSRNKSASMTLKRFDYNDALGRSKSDKGVIDRGCSRHMTGNMSYLSNFKELNGGNVAFGGNPKGGKISRKGKIQTCKLDFDDFYFDKELKFNLFNVSQMCDKKNIVLFTDTECLVLSPDFKLPDGSQVLLRVPRENNIEFSVPRTPQQNSIAERKNRTLIEAARTMLADLLLLIPFWAEAFNTACYVQNRVLVTKPHNKTPYELLHSRTPSIGFMRPFGCPVTILNTLDSLGKFEGKVDEGFLVGYSVSSKSFRVFNSRTRIVQETLHVNFLENKPNVTGSGPTWLFDIDSLTKTMNYQPIIAGNQSNPSAGFQDQFVAEKAKEETDQQYVLFPVWSSSSTNPQNTDGDAAFKGNELEFDEKNPESEVNVSLSSSAQSRKQDDKTKKEAKGKSLVESFTGYRDLNAKFKDYSDNSINKVNAAELEDITYFDDEDDVGAEADFNNLENLSQSVIFQQQKFIKIIM